MQLDRVVAAPGVFEPARTFSIVRDEGGVYLIYTGRAMGIGKPVGPGIAGTTASAILEATARRRATEIEEVEAQLKAAGAAALVDTKHSRFLPRTAIKDVTIADGVPTGWPVVVIHADTKHKLHFTAHRPDEVREFFAPFVS